MEVEYIVPLLETQDKMVDQVAVVEMVNLVDLLELVVQEILLL